MDNYCKKDLLAMGWTQGAIERFLPYPDIESRRHGNGRHDIYLWATDTVEQARQLPEVQLYFDRLQKRHRRVTKSLPLLDAIREISRAAHRWRDAASAQFEARNYGLATYSSSRKNYFYELKERGIAAAYGQGLLRYAGQTPQGMAVYEYGAGGMSCFHSCFHPAGVARRIVEDHPETLFVAAKKQRELVGDAERTLLGLPVPGAEFERSDPPRVEKPTESIKCFECGKEGHIARECPERDGDCERD